MNRSSRSPSRTVLIVLDLFVAATAIGGGLALALGLEHERFPRAWLAGSPFDDFVAPGLLLAIVVGGSAAGASIALLRGSRRGARASLLAGLVLAFWIIGEVVLLTGDGEPISPTEALYLAIATAMAGLSVHLERAPNSRDSVGSLSRVGPEPARYIRPTFVMAHLVNPVVARIGGTLVLVVTGRRTGRSLKVPLGRPFEVEGTRYLVAGGGQTHWVRNLRDAGGAELRCRGVTTPFRPVELDGADRDRIVATYRSQQGRTVEPFFRQLPEAWEHPVFRVEPLTARPTTDRPPLTGGAGADPARRSPDTTG